MNPFLDEDQYITIFFIPQTLCVIKSNRITKLKSVYSIFFSIE